MLTAATPTTSTVPNETRLRVEIASYLKNAFPDYAFSRVFPPGVELFRHGETAREVFVMESGIVKLTRSENNGREFIVGLRFSNSLLGSSTIVSAQRHPFTAVTVTSCRLLQISRTQFTNLMNQDQRVNSFVSTKLGREISELIVQITHLACVPVRQRLQQLLWRLSKDEFTEYNGGTKIQLPLKYWEVAALLAITPAYLTRLFDELETSGLLSRDKGWIQIPAPNNLWHDPTLDPI